MSQYSLNIPINSVSFGQVSVALMRELQIRKEEPCIFPIGQPDISSQKVDQNFINWINTCIGKSLSHHKRSNKTFKLWHIEGSLESFSEKQVLLTFYELDQPTEQEMNIIRNNYKVIVTNEYSANVLRDYGADNVEYIPLGFDKANFSRKEKVYFDDGRITFNVVGKFEKRKQHEKLIKAWIKNFKNDRRYFLQCAIYNPFFSPQENEEIVKNLTDGNKYFNVQFVSYMQQNDLYNDFLNSGDIVLGMGTEGFGLPEMHSVAMGKHAVILDAAGYKAWATSDNSILVKPTGKEPVYDNKFFVKGQWKNQGNIFTWQESDFIDACNKAIEKVKSKKLNEKGLELQKTHSYEIVTDKILKLLD